MRLRRGLLTAVVIVCVPACASADVSTDPTQPPLVVAAGPCPSPFVVQTDQEPTADLGFLYGAFRGDITIDPARRSVSGRFGSTDGTLDDLILEIRHGGAVTGFDQVSTVMGSDASVTAGLVATDEAILNSARHPTTAVFAPFHKSPTIVFWDGDAYPGRDSIQQFKVWDISIIHEAEAPFMEHLIATDVLHAKQSVPAADGTPVSYLASGGRMPHQGSATVDPYAYRHIYKDWQKDINFQYVHDMGWDPYPLTLSVRDDDMETLADCLASIVPELQRASRSFLADPQSGIERIVETARRFGGNWSYTTDQARAAVERITQDALWDFPEGTVIGGFDRPRIQSLIDKARASHPTPDDIADALVAGDLATDRFLDATLVSDRSRSD